MAAEHFQCTAETPWRKDLPTPVEHSSVEEVGEQQDGWPSGDTVLMRCKNCGTTWTMELPQ